MSKEFDKKFASLINYSVPRSFMRTQDTDGDDIPAQRDIDAGDKLPTPPSDGFIAKYCCEDEK